MVQICTECNKLLKEGEYVTVQVTSTYHVLKSAVAYALDKNDLIADVNTLRHKDCPK